MTSLDDFARLAEADHGLCVVSTVRADGTIQSSVVNAGVLDHPVDGYPVVGFVAGSASRKLQNLRMRPQVTVVVRSGFHWQAVEGTAELAGPDDDMAGIEPDSMRLLLRQVFTAAGGLHDDWETYDRVMAEERRTAVFVTPRRVYSNG
jgi:PPOX class probable F420-dependent enzyme